MNASEMMCDMLKQVNQTLYKAEDSNEFIRWTDQALLDAVDIFLAVAISKAVEINRKSSDAKILQATERLCEDVVGLVLKHTGININEHSCDHKDSQDFVFDGENEVELTDQLIEQLVKEKKWGDKITLKEMKSIGAKWNNVRNSVVFPTELL